MGSKAKQLLSVAAPILGTLLLPGVGTALGIGGLTTAGGAATALGGAFGGGLGGVAGGALSGGGLGGALKGGALGAAGGYLGSGGASDLIGGTQVGNALGLSNPAGGSYIGNAIGSAPGAFSDGSTSLSGLLSGSGEYANAPGISSDLSFGSPSTSNLIGVGKEIGTGLGGVSSGASSALTGGGSALSAGTGAGISSYGSGIGTLLGAASSLSANDQAQKDLLKAQRNSLNELQPYLNSGQAANSRLSELLGTGGNASASDYGSLTKPFDPGDLTQDPGYKFQLEQGTNAINRSLGAKGNLFSGSALKAAQDYGTGLADQTYKDAYARDLATKQNTYNQYAGQGAQGQNAANSAGTIFGNTGNAQANAGISSSNILNQTLSSLLSGSGAKRFLGYGQNGQPIYA